MRERALKQDKKRIKSWSLVENRREKQDRKRSKFKSEGDKRSMHHGSSKKKKETADHTSLLPGYLSSRAFPILLWYVTNMYSRQEKHDTLLKSVEGRLIKMEDRDKLKKNNFTFEGPIGNLQICGDGRNEMNIRKDELASAMLPTPTMLPKGVPPSLPTPVPASLASMLVSSSKGLSAVKMLPTSTTSVSQPSDTEEEEDDTMLTSSEEIDGEGEESTKQSEAVGTVGAEQRAGSTGGEGMEATSVREAGKGETFALPSWFNPLANQGSNRMKRCEGDSILLKFAGLLDRSSDGMTDTDFESDSEYESGFDWNDYDSVDEMFGYDLDMSDIDEGGMVSGLVERGVVSELEERGMVSELEEHPDSVLRTRPKPQEKPMTLRKAGSNREPRVPYAQSFSTGLQQGWESGVPATETNQKVAFGTSLSANGRAKKDFEPPMSANDTGWTQESLSDGSGVDACDCETDGEESFLAEVDAGPAPDTESGVLASDEGGMTPGLSTADTGQTSETVSDMSVSNTSSGEADITGGISHLVDAVVPAVSAEDTVQKGNTKSHISSSDGTVHSPGTDSGGTDVSTALTLHVEPGGDTDWGGGVFGSESSVPDMFLQQIEGTIPGDGKDLVDDAGSDPAGVSPAGTGVFIDAKLGSVDAGPGMAYFDTVQTGVDVSRHDGVLRDGMATFDTEQAGVGVSRQDTVPEGCLEPDELADCTELCSAKVSAVSATDTGQPLCVDSCSMPQDGGQFTVKAADFLVQEGIERETVLSPKKTSIESVPKVVSFREENRRKKKLKTPTSSKVSTRSNIPTFQEEVNNFASEQTGSQQITSDKGIFCMGITKGEISFVREETVGSTNQVLSNSSVMVASGGPGGTISGARESQDTVENLDPVAAERSLKGKADTHQFSVPKAVSCHYTADFLRPVQESQNTDGNGGVQLEEQGMKVGCLFGVAKPAGLSASSTTDFTGAAQDPPDPVSGAKEFQHTGNKGSEWATQALKGMEFGLQFGVPETTDIPFSSNPYSQVPVHGESTGEDPFEVQQVSGTLHGFDFRSASASSSPFSG